MRSLDKISLTAIADDNPYLGKIWGGIFYHPVFVNAASGILGLTGQSQIVSIEDKSVGVFNHLHRERFGFRTASTPHLFQYFGPVFFENPNPDSLADYSDALNDHIAANYDFIYFSLPPKCGLPDRFMEKFHIVAAATPALGCDDLNRWGRGFRDDVKNKVNKAKKEHVNVTTSDSLPEKLWEMTFARQGMVPPIQPAMLTRWCRPLIQNSLLRIYVAQIDRRPVAFRGELIFGDYAYDWIAGSDPSFHSSGANQFLMAEIGNEISKMNLTAWDLVGAGVKSIADFKKSFGAREIEYLHVYKALNFKGQIFNILRNIRHGRE